MPNNPPPHPKHAFVTVELLSDSPLDYHIHSDDLPLDKDGNLVFSNNGHPGFQVEFELDDRTGKGYSFPPNNKRNDALWSKFGSDCPQRAASDVFTVQSVRPHRMGVVALNPNVKTGQFMYNVRVTLDGGATYLDIDPGGMNTNGPSRSTRSSIDTLSLAAGAVAGVALTLGYQALAM